MPRFDLVGFDERRAGGVWRRPAIGWLRAVCVFLTMQIAGSTTATISTAASTTICIKPLSRGLKLRSAWSRVL
uniref:Uncharacterized protein n=1 Tax=Anguilla anguilla TaxID=7936 RepID=A0A0E9X2R1_ANGAN